MKEKVTDLVRLHEAMQQKQYHTQNKSKFFPESTVQNLMPLNTLFELYMKLKKQVEY